MNVLITGSSGLIGTALRSRLTEEGHSIFCMIRGVRQSDSRFSWFPSEGIINLDESGRIDAVVHLAGAGIADKRWSPERKKIIFESRVNSTRLLAGKLASLSHKPEVFISGSAIGFYGNTLEKTVDESSPAGTGFLPYVCSEWERAARPAINAGIRTVFLRTGIVLSKEGGALAKMLTPFRLGLGGVIGSGDQYMSWISMRDMVEVIVFVLKNSSLRGPVNAVSNKPVTNGIFTEMLAKVLNRPVLFPVPSFAVKIVFGEMADEILLTGQRVLPWKLLDAGFEFSDNDLETALKSILNN